MSGKSGIKGFVFWIVVIFAMLMVGSASGATLTVDDSGGADYLSIQAAIDNATVGDTIYVYNGSYTENVNVNKRVTLQGEGADVVTVTSASTSDNVFEVTVDYVNISGFKVTGATGGGGFEAGFYLSSSQHSNLSNNNALGNTVGIHLVYSSNNTLTNNTLNSNTYSGFRLFSSSNNTLTNNTANSNNEYGIIIRVSRTNILTNNTANLNRDSGIYLGHSGNNNTLANNNASYNNYGIRLEHSSNNTLTNNTMSGNTYNFDVSGNSLTHYTHEVNTSNKVQNKPIYYWVNMENQEVPTDAGFVGIINSTNITVKDLNVTQSYAGVLFVYTNNSSIINVNVSNNNYGIRLYSSSNNMLMNNNASGNTVGIWLQSLNNNNTLINNIANLNSDGIYLYSSNNNNTLTNNTANLNLYRGILLESSNNNTLTNNTMSGNRYNFYVRGTSLSHYMHEINTSNKVENKPIYYWVNMENQVVSNDAGFVAVINSTNITVEDLNVTKNYVGLLFAYTNNSRIINNNVSDNYYGIQLYSSSNNTLINNVANSNSDGIYLHSSSNNTLTNNNANLNSNYGIWFESSSNNTLTNNTANSNNDRGIRLYSSSNNMLTNNIANSNTNYGIYLYSSSNNTLTNNTMSGNKYNFGVYGTSLIEYTHDINTSNKVENKPIYYWIDYENQEVPNDAGFVGIINSTNITVRDLKLTENYEGVLFVYTDDSRIINVNVSNNIFSIYMRYSNNNTLTNNIANSNSNYGIYLYSSNNNTLTNNTANSNSICGIRLDYSSDNMLTKNTANSNSNSGIYLSYSSNNNTIYNNYFNNTNNALDTGGYNIWNTTKTAGTNIVGGSWFGGNYWSDYAGADTDSDYLGDTLIPYNSSGNIANGGDYHPLFVYTTSPSTPTSNNGGGSGGGGGGGASGETYENIENSENYEKEIYMDISTNYHFKENGVVEDINIIGNINAGSINVKVEVLHDTSSLVNKPAPGNVYKNLNILVGGAGFAVPKNIKEATIKFSVNKKWIDENSIGDVILYSYSDGVWQPLQTEKIEVVGENVYYRSTTNHFSPFAISGVQKFEDDTVSQAVSTELESSQVSIDNEFVSIISGILGFALPKGGSTGISMVAIGLVGLILLGLIIVKRRQ